MRKSSRVNITLDSPETKQNDRSLLSFKMLVMGQFGERDKHKPLASRARKTIHPHNFEQVMKYYNPRVRFKLANNSAEGEPITVDLSPTALKDFHPDNLVKAIPQIKTLYAKRRLLKELKLRLLERPDLVGEMGQHNQG